MTKEYIFTFGNIVIHFVTQVLPSPSGVNFINVTGARVFHTYVVSAAFFTYIGTYILRKKLPKQRSHKKRTRKC